MKNNKSNINYFKKWEGLKTLGLGLLIVGFIGIWMTFSYFVYLASIALLAAGVVLFLVGNIGRSTEADITQEIKRRSHGIEFPEVETEKGFHKRVPDKQEILDFSGFSFPEGALLKRMKNGSVCSSEYVAARMLLLTDAFYAKTRNFSLISDAEEEVTFEIPFSAVENVTVERENKTAVYNGKSFAVKLCHLVITHGEGQKLCLPTTDDVYADQLAENLAKLTRE